MASCRRVRLFEPSSEEAPGESVAGIRTRRQTIRENSKLVRKRLRLKFDELVTVKTITNAIFIVSICIICFQQCYFEISDYLEFKTRIQVNHVFPSATILMIPGITICNNNRLRLSKIAEEIPGLGERVKNIIGDPTEAIMDERKRIEVIRSIKQAVDETINITSIINESPIGKLMDLSRSSMIKDINCNTAWGEQINCENIRIVESYQASPCYTAFYLGSFLEALGNKKAFDFNTSALSGTRRVLPFDSHEVADVVIDFEPFQHADFYRDPGGKVVIHSTGHVGSVSDVAHSLLPGFKYEIILQRYMSRRLPPPYESMCFDYKFVHSKEFTTKENTLPSVELDKTTCTRNCIIRKATRACNCWPVEIPYYPGDQVVNGSFKMCPWGYEEANLNGNFSAHLYAHCYRKFHSECRNQCRLGCRTEDYKVHLITNPWPSREKFFLATTDKERQEVFRLRGCCSMISIKYLEFMEKRHIMYPHVTLAQMVSNIGGIVSALVGVSTVTIYRYITRRVFHCKTVSNYKPPDMPAGDRKSAGRWPSASTSVVVA